MTQAITRRSFATLFGKGAAMLGLGSLVSVTTACPAWVSNLYADILKYAPVALNAFSAVLSILSASGIPMAGILAVIIADAKAAFADIQVAVQQYQAAPAGQKTGLLGAISEAIAVAEATLQKFWSDLSIPDVKLASLIEGLLGIITSTLMGFATQLPAPITPAAQQMQRMKAGFPKLLTAPPQKRSLKQFKNDFNAKLKAAGYQKHAI
jgi:hypothetical protein